MMTYEEFLIYLKQLSDPIRAQKSQQYLQVFPGGYGYPDQFLGLTNPQVRQVSKLGRTSDFQVIEQLWLSEYHEVRLLATIIINEQYRSEPARGEQFYRLYTQQSQSLNNWDLVDTLGPHFIGPYLYEQHGIEEVWRLAKSQQLFEQRMAVISQFAWIRQGEDELLYELAKFFINHPHDLIHKAVGWLLREAGKRDEAKLCRFLDDYTANLPRTMLRYAIEKLPPTKRQAYLAIKKVK
ncbi:MAG: DNA alkylation repair protein [Culicoidibacterales bacterium]